MNKDGNGQFDWSGRVSFATSYEQISDSLRSSVRVERVHVTGCHRQVGFRLPEYGKATVAHVAETVLFALGKENTAAIWWL